MADRLARGGMVKPDSPRLVWDGAGESVLPKDLIGRGFSQEDVDYLTEPGFIPGKTVTVEISVCSVTSEKDEE